MAASNTVNNLVSMVEQWLEQSIGQSVYDDQVQAVVLYQLDEATGNYKLDKSLPANSRQDIIRKVRTLGGR